MKISGILPTRGRQEWAAQAVACFLSQTYPDKELIVIDDADDPSFPNGIDQQGIRYQISPIRSPIPEKRNACCELTTGEVIAHFDSDDWSDPTRLEIQMGFFRESGKSVIGFHTMLFWDVANQKAYKYRGWPGYAMGSSLVYRREWWLERRWKSIRHGIGSDNVFVREAHDANQLHTADAGILMVARTHANNTSVKQMYKDPYVEVSSTALPVHFPKGLAS